MKSRTDIQIEIDSLTRRRNRNAASVKKFEKAIRENQGSYAYCRNMIGAQNQIINACNGEIERLKTELRAANNRH